MSKVIGRPTKYSEEQIDGLCERVLYLFKDGLSQVEVATDIGLTYDSYLLYQQIYPKFRESIKKGLQLSQAWWLKQGREGLNNPKFSFTGWSMQVRNRFGLRTDEQPVHLPALKEAITFTDKINVITHAISDGRITPSEAKRLCEAIAIGAKVEEVTELKQMIEQLQDNLKYRDE